MINLIEPIFLNHSVHISKSLIKPHDIAKKLGTIGYLNKLIRTKVGEFNISNTIKMKDFEKQWKSIAN